MTGPSVAGGGSIAVDTAEMVRAASVLARAGEHLGAVESRAERCAAALPASVRRLHADEAALLLGRARRSTDSAADGLRIAAQRYGEVEHGIRAAQETLAAGAATGVGTAMRLSVPVLGIAGPVLIGSAVVDVLAVAAAVRTVQRTVETGRFAPQADPELLRGLALLLASLDDGARGGLLLPDPGALRGNDPTAPMGTESVAAALAALLLLPAGGPLAVTATERRPVRAPRDLASLADRLPDGAEPGGQVRIERYDGADGTRWIVYIAGTVTFARDSGEEPFDLASDVLGVAHRPSDSERAVLQAMADAGIAADEPVLLVGHSQGALNAVRVAQDGGYRVGGVVGFGGPTGQIVLPADVPVLSVEHDEDLVPVLGGTAASGAAGLRRVVVRRTLPDAGFGVPTSAATSAFPAHDLGAYRRTTAEAEASGDERVRAFRDRIAPFLRGEGTATRYRAARVSPGPDPTAAAGSCRRGSR